MSEQIQPFGKETPINKVTIKEPAHKNVLQRAKEYAAGLENLPQIAHTGFPNVDKISKIFGLAVLGAGSGAGKTSFALNVAYRRIFTPNKENEENATPKPTIYISLEMTAAEIMQRFAAIVGNLTANKVTGQMIEYLQKNNALQYLTIIDNSDTEGGRGGFDEETIKQDIAAIRQQTTEKDILIIIDSLNLIDSEGYDERRAINQIIRKLSRFSKNNGVNILLIAQLTKEALTKGKIKEVNPADENADFEELLYDFRESALIPYLADSCFFLLADKNSDKTDKNNETGVYLCTAKNRRAAINTKVRFTFDKQTFRFDEQ